MLGLTLPKSYYISNGRQRTLYQARYFREPVLEDTSSVKEVLLIFVCFSNHRLLCVCSVLHISLKINLTDLEISDT